MVFAPRLVDVYLACLQFLHFIESGSSRELTKSIKVYLSSCMCILPLTYRGFVEFSNKFFIHGSLQSHIQQVK